MLLVICFCVQMSMLVINEYRIYNYNRFCFVHIFLPLNTMYIQIRLHFHVKSLNSKSVTNLIFTNHFTRL